jgi:RNA polymerase sigma-70 factor (TIGR02943 family)
VPAKPETWVDEHGDYLFRFALSRLRRRDLAEDLVQETFLAALQARGRFAGQSSERTWLVGILKHKIVDHLRRRTAEQRAANPAELGRWVDGLFDERGKWREKPGKWPADPGTAFEKTEFWAIFAACLRKLPERLANAFTLRAVEEMDSPEVCKVLGVTANNLWVMLHRARLGLWRCLQIHWFGTKK